jgi:hypothetical protein
MRSQTNIQGLRSDKRFDALVKQEMIEHQHLISCHNKEMQALRDNLNLAMQKFDSLFEKSVMELKDFKTHAVCTMGLLKEKAMANESTIAEQRRTIEDLHEQLLSFQGAYSSKVDAEKLKKDFALEIKANTISHINAFQEFQREFKDLIHSLENDLLKLRCEMQQKLAELTEKMESNFSISRIDKEGVLKEVRIYEKSMFIIEKKIENIYTLIERINKRGEICHKQE